MKALTISELEQQTGVRRGTVYFYLRQGLLPPPSKTGATRSLYDQSHVEILREIVRLREQGHSLRAIREQLAPRIADARRSGADLAALQTEQVRSKILEAAARQFARYGYRQTRILDVCAEAGVTPQVLYTHFPSKRQLFIACYRVYFEWMRSRITPHLQGTEDPIARMAWRIHASNQIQALSPDLQALARVETVKEESEVRELLRTAYDQMMAEVQEDLAAARSSGRADAPFDDELLAYALLGALELMQMRALWDDKYGQLDIARNFLLLYAAALAVYAGAIDVSAKWHQVSDLVQGILQEEQPKVKEE